MRRFVTRAAVILLLTAVLLEVVLQIGAYVVWSQRGSAAQRSEGDGPVVLCVGDSMTYGLGSTSGGAYPTQLQRTLREQDDRSWVVINGGWPGSNTRDVMTRLEDQLPRDVPDYVAVLVGVNNQWVSTETLETAADAESFPLVWRTGRLIDIMLAGALGDRPPRGFVGVWHLGEFEIEFEPAGRLVLASGEVRWIERDDRLFVVMPDETEHVVDWELADGKLRLRSAVWPNEQILEPGRSPNRPPLAVGKQAIAQRDWPTAIEAFRAAVDAGDPRVVEAHEGLVAAYVQTGQEDAAQREFENIVALDDDSRPCDATVRGARAHALLALSRFSEAIDLAIGLVADHPDDSRGWEILIHVAPAHGASDKVLAAIDSSIAALPEDHALRSQLLFQRALLVRHGDPDSFLRAAIQARRANAEDDTIANLISLGADALDDEVFARVTADLGEQEAREMRALYERGMRAEAAHAGLLERHLTQILATCRAAGAAPILLEYPFPSAGHRATVARVAERTDTPLVSIRPHFERLLETMPQESLFVADDVHCTDLGYGEMAKRVAEVLLGLPR